MDDGEASVDVEDLYLWRMNNRPALMKTRYARAIYHKYRSQSQGSTEMEKDKQK